MLRVFKSKSELRELIELVDSRFLPELVDLHEGLKIALDNLTPDAPFEVHAYPWSNVKVFIYVVRNKYTRTAISFKLVDNGTLDDVDRILDAAPTLFDDFKEFIIFNTDINIYAHLEESLSAKFTFTIKPPDPCHTFYMPIEKQHEVAKMNIVLPDGFHFYDLDPEKDAEFVSGKWKYATATDVPNTKSKIAYLPSTGVKFDDKLVAFELLQPYGSLNHLYVLPEFRGKGVGTAVELKQCQKLIEMGLCPYKFVEVNNEQAMSMTKKSGLWLSVRKSNSEEEPGCFAFEYVFRK